MTSKIAVGLLYLFFTFPSPLKKRNPLQKNNDLDILLFARTTLLYWPKSIVKPPLSRSKKQIKFKI